MQKPERQLSPDAVSELLAVIQASVRATLRVSLRPTDGSQKNQDGLELVNDGWLKLQRRLHQDPPINNPKAYAHLTGKKLCFDYFRRLSVRHRSLQDSALRYLRLIPEFSAWKVEKQWLTGFAKWQTGDTTPADVETLDTLVGQTDLLDPRVAALRWEDYRKQEWRHVMDRIFTFAGAPLWLDDLIGLMFVVMNIEEVQMVEMDFELSAHPGPDIQTISREELSATWEEIVELPRAQRIAVLLNSAGGELDALPIAGIATLEEIAQALAITPSEFDVLWSELGLPPNQVAEAQSLATPEEKFGFLWCHTPI